MSAGYGPTYTDIERLRPWDAAGQSWSEWMEERDLALTWRPCDVIWARFRGREPLSPEWSSLVDLEPYIVPAWYAYAAGEGGPGRP